MIEARGLTRRYGDFTAVRDVSFSVADGEILGILGPNGAGKTTTIRMITGFLPPSDGQVTINGRDLFEDPIEARKMLGYLPENVALYPEMRVDEYLAFRAQLAGMKKAQQKEAIDKAVSACLLGGVRHQIIGTLSKGYRQRVGLSAAILHGPRVLVLDEPTVGLDPNQIIAIRELIRDLGRQRTLLLSTHILPEVEQLCDRVLIIDRGRLIAEGTPAELRERARGQSHLTLTFKSADAGTTEKLGKLPGVALVTPLEEAGRYRIEVDKDADAREAVFRLAVDSGLVLLELAEKKVSLEDVFVRLTQDPAAAAASVALIEAEEAQAAAAADAEETETPAEQEKER